MIEVLVTIIILTFGLLGLAGLVGRAITAENEAFQRAQAVILLDEMADMINVNRLAAPCFVEEYGAWKGGTPLTPCTGLSVAQQVMDSADLAMTEWHGRLLGTMEKIGATDVGGALNAHGCVTASAATPGLYYVAVAWQGLGPTAGPVAPGGAEAALVSAVACGEDAYGTEAHRRLVWTAVRIATLDGV